MVLEIVYQNSLSLNEVSLIFDSLVKEKASLIEKIKMVKEEGKKEELAFYNNRLDIVNKKIEQARYYIIKLLTNMQKVLDGLNFEDVK